MSTPYNLPDYQARNFKHKHLTKIYGEPNIDSIVTLFLEVKRNTQSVKTTLGGAQHGYLALVLTDNVYANISGTSPFVCPVDPGTFSPVEPENTGVSTRASTAETTTTLTSAVP